MAFDSNVFLNCPFDEEYALLRNALIFTIVDCGFVPRCALEMMNGGVLRMQGIKQMIAESRFGIHDISRTQLDSDNQLPRFNMPLELGIFIGAATFGGRLQRTKSSLILDTERFRYQKYISDIAGHDIRTHGGDERAAISHVRNWLSAESANGRLPGGLFIFSRFTQFRDDLPAMCSRALTNPVEIAYQDYVNFVVEWTFRNPIPRVSSGN